MLNICIKTIEGFWGIISHPGVIICVAVLSIMIAFEFVEYNKSTYYSITQNSFFKTRCDLGRYGEYLIYKKLKRYESQNSKFLFNVYLPTTEGTSEVDVMLICEKGILVFESKNYSGWIFGDENKRMWTQTLAASNSKVKKTQFYNPVMQNSTHIKHLKNLIGDDLPIYSVIVFSDRCVLKNIKVKFQDTYVIKRNDLTNIISEIYDKQSKKIELQIIENVYNSLYSYTQINEKTKQQHIFNVSKKKNEP